jgi:hypothetical protein
MLQPHTLKSTSHPYILKESTSNALNIDRIKINVYYQIKCHHPKSVLHNPIVFAAA